MTLMPATTALSLALRERFSKEMQVQNSTKRSALRIALVGAIHDGVLKPQQRLPSEIELAEDIGVSLGTVQSALGQLQDMGLILRRRGDGTRIADTDKIDPSVWHFRFRMRDSGKPLRLLQQDVELLTTSELGPWSEHLGELAQYRVIKRSIIGTNNTPMGARMYLDDALVAPIRLSARELQSANMRMVLEHRLGIVAAQTTHEAVVVTLEAEIATQFGMTPGQQCFEVHARTTTSAGKPFYYQEIFVPTDAVSLIF
jgi:GntR family transcriptional regulator